MQLKPYLTALLVILVASSAARAERFVIFGDLQDSSPEGRLRDAELVDRINEIAPAFSVYIGDIKEGGSRCTDDLFGTMREVFDRHERPFDLHAR
ncbi:MAG: hypothetical protein AAGA87_11330 [Pseudomonadota bacterium]